MTGKIIPHQNVNITGMKVDKKNRARTFFARLIVLAIIVTCFPVVFFMINKAEEAVINPLPVKYTFIPSPEIRSLNRPDLNKTASLPHTLPITFSEPACYIESVPAVLLRETGTFGGKSYDEPVIAVEKRSMSDQERFYESTKSVRIPHNRVNMREELISIDDLDYGRYRVLINRDNGNKRNIRGFLYIATIWGQQLRIPDKLKRSVINLAEAVTRYTGIRAEIDSHLMLDSRRLHSTPFVFITTDCAFEHTPAERENFGAYLRNGGFAFVDNGTPQYPHGQAEASLRKMLRDSLGAHARFLPVPVSHTVYHSFFDFDDGPPQSAEVQPFTTQEFIGGCSGECRHFTMSRPMHYLEGIWFKGRFVAIYSDKGYSQKWRLHSTIPSANNVPQLKMGVNMVVFALTQKDGIAERNGEWYF